MINKYNLSRAVGKLAQPSFRDKLKGCAVLLIDDVGRWAEAIEDAKRHSVAQAIVQLTLPTFYAGVNAAINYPPPEPPSEPEVDNASAKPIIVDIPTHHDGMSSYENGPWK